MTGRRFPWSARDNGLKGANRIEQIGKGKEIPYRARLAGKEDRGGGRSGKGRGEQTEEPSEPG